MDVYGKGIEGQRSRELLATLAGALQEVLDQCSPKVFGKYPKLNLPAADCYNDKDMGHVLVGITGTKRVLGFLWNKRQVTGDARIVGGGFMDTRLFGYGNRGAHMLTHVRTYYPTTEELKEQLLAALARKKLLKHDI